MIPGIVAGQASVEPALPAEAHRYWRIRVTAVQSATPVAIGRLEMYESHWGVNVMGGGTISASSTSIGGYDAWKCADNDISDQNAGVYASGGLPASLKYDFGSGNDKAITAIGIYSGYVGLGENNCAPTTFYIEYSDDDSTWTTYWSETSVSWTGKRWARFVHPDFVENSYSGSPHGSHRYWQFNTVQTAGAGYTSAGEVQLRAAPGGADQCSGGTAFADSWFSAPATTYAPDKAFDDVTTTFWVNNGGRGRIGYDFGGSPVAVGELILRSRHDTQTDQTPRWGVLQYTEDTSGLWTTVLEIVNQTSWATNDQRTFTDPNYV